MTRFTLSVLLMLVAGFLVAQSQHSFNLVASTDYLFRSHERIDGFYEADPALHFQIGVDYNRSLSTNWRFTSGIRLTHFRFDSGDLSSAVYQQVISAQFGGGGLNVTEGEFANMNRLQVTDYFAAVPLQLRFQPNAQTRFYVQGGVNLLFYLKTHTRIDLSDEKQNEWQRQSKNYVDTLLPSFSLGAGWFWDVGRGQAVFLQPTARYFLLQGSDTRWWSAGFEVGFRW